ncbi:hypothetical protein BDZ89DRAFT_969228, partial [Hymenopellis radicata]
LRDEHCWPDTQVRCFAHVLNLIYKAICSVFEKKKKKKKGEPEKNTDGDEDVDEEWDDEDDEPTVEDIEALREREALDADDERELEEIGVGDRTMEEPSVEALKAGIKAMTKVFSYSFCLRTVLILLQILKLGHRCAIKKRIQHQLAILCKASGLKATTMVKRVATRWNTMNNVIRRATNLQVPLDKLCMLPMFNIGKPTTRLRRFKLTPNEWALMWSLRPVFKLIQDATTLISTKARPMLHEVIPTMDALNKGLEAKLVEDGVPEIVRYAITKGLAVLDKYYVLTDDSLMWRLCMSAYLILSCLC